MALFKVIDAFRVVNLIAKCQCCSYLAHQDLLNVYMEKNRLLSMCTCELNDTGFPQNPNAERPRERFCKPEGVKRRDRIALSEEGDGQTREANSSCGPWAEQKEPRVTPASAYSSEARDPKSKE